MHILIALTIALYVTADRPPIQRIKLDEVVTSNGGSASPAPPSTSVEATPAPTVVKEEVKSITQDPLAGKTPVQKKLKDEKYIKVSNFWSVSFLCSRNSNRFSFHSIRYQQEHQQMVQPLLFIFLITQ